MYSRRQRSTRNAAATTNTNTSANARTTRGRTNKAKHPRRGGGNPDTARVRASIERSPVVPWVKVMRPPAFHLRRTFFVEKWVRPSDLTATERKVYDAEQKEKEEERHRLLKWQQQKREQEEMEKEREEDQQRKLKEKEESLIRTARTGHGGENAKRMESKGEEQNDENSASKLISGTPTPIVLTITTTRMASTLATAIASTATSKVPTDTTSDGIGQSEAAQVVVPTLELEQTQAPLRVSGAEDVPTLTTSKTRVSLMKNVENKTSSPLAPDTITVVNTDQDLQEQIQALPQKNGSDSKEAPRKDSSTTVNRSEKITPKEVQQQEPSDAEDTSLAAEPLTKKLRVEQFFSKE